MRTNLLVISIRSFTGSGPEVMDLRRSLKDVINEAVRQSLLRGEPPVPVGVCLNLLERLTGVLGNQLLHGRLDVQRLLRLDPDIACRAAKAARGLMHHDPAVRQGVPLAFLARAQQELTHRCSQTDRDGRHVVGDPPHGVVDRHPRVDRSAR